MRLMRRSRVMMGGHSSKHNQAAHSPLEPRVGLQGENDPVDQDVFSRYRPQSIESISDGEYEPSTKSEAGVGGRRSQRDMPGVNPRAQHILKEQCGLQRIMQFHFICICYGRKSENENLAAFIGCSQDNYIALYPPGLPSVYTILNCKG